VSLFKRALPWLFLVGALAVSSVIINGTAPSACDLTPRAFDRGVQTDVGGDDLGLYSSCEVTDTATAVSEKVTQINWSGLIGALALCAAAWCLGALLGGVLDRRRGLTLLLIAVLVAAVALAVSFL
jgi:hypothetical protein